VKVLNCPINGTRSIQEFAYGGEYREMPDPDTATDAEWTDYVYNRGGGPGVQREWWNHIASGTWFIAERDNETDDIKKTYLYGEE
jgi:sarcosine oxidase subunit delta